MPAQAQVAETPKPEPLPGTDPVETPNNAQAGVEEEPLPEATTINLDEEPGAEKPKAEEKPAEEPRRGQPRQRRVVNELRHQLQESEERARIAEEERDKWRNRHGETDTAALTQYERASALAVKLAERELHDATVSGDADQITKATSGLTRAQADAAALDTWKAGRPAKDKEPARAEPRPARQPAAAEPTEEVKAWAERNPWVMKDHADFDQEMAEEVVDYGKILERKYRRAGKTAEIGSRAFFDELDKHMDAQFPIEDEEPAPTRQPPKMMRPAAGVSPANRAVPGAVNKDSPGYLTGEEQNFAKGFGFEYPPGHPQAGKRMSDMDAMRAYARQRNALNTKKTA